jgi:hypothetical protein
MSNKIFIPFLVLLAAGFFGWMVYDSVLSGRDIRAQQSSGSLLLDTATGKSAMVQYIFNFPEPVYSHELTTQQIEAMSQRMGGDEPYRVYGITVADYKLDALYEFNWSKKWFKPEYDMWVENLRVEFSYNTVNVYVTSNYAVESCEYQVALEHENRHVAIHRRVYGEYQQVLKDTVGHSTAIPLAGRPITVPSVERGKEIISKIISNVTDPVFEKYKQALTEEQAAIDTKASYEGLKERCRNW